MDAEQSEIIIVHEIGRIQLSPDGRGDGLKVAFELASEYVLENTRSGQPMGVSFTFGETRFVVGSEPA